MNTLGLPDDDQHREVFLDSLLSGSAAQLPLGPGIQLCALHAGKRRGLALQVAREALHAGQVQRVLERRFEQAAAFEGCFVYLDAQGVLVIWHAVPTSRSALDRVLSRLLSLAKLDTLDTRDRR